MSRNHDDIDIFQEQLDASLSAGAEEIYAHHIQDEGGKPLEGEVIIDEEQVEDPIRHKVDDAKERADTRRMRNRKKKKILAGALIGVGSVAMALIAIMPDKASDHNGSPSPALGAPVKPVISSQYSPPSAQKTVAPAQQEARPDSTNSEKTSAPVQAQVLNNQSEGANRETSTPVKEKVDISPEPNEQMNKEDLERIIEERLNAKLGELKKAHQSQVDQLEEEIKKLKQELADAKRKAEKPKKRKPRFLGDAPTVVKVLQDGLLLRRTADGELVVGAVGERLKVYGRLIRVYPAKNMFLTDRGLWRVKQ